MKKLFALLLAAVMLSSFAACDTGDDPNPSGSKNPGTSQNGGENNNGGGENNGGDAAASDEIMVKSLSSGYSNNDGYAFVVISFARPNGEEIAFAHPDGSAITLGNAYVLSDGFDCFSLTDGFEVIGVTVDEESVTVDFAATYEEYDQASPSITYTPASDPFIKTTSGEVIDGFTYKFGYINFDLYE